MVPFVVTLLDGCDYPIALGQDLPNPPSKGGLVGQSPRSSVLDNLNWLGLLQVSYPLPCCGDVSTLDTYLPALCRYQLVLVIALLDKTTGNLNGVPIFLMIYKGR